MGRVSGFFIAPHLCGTLGKRPTKAGAVVGIVCAIATVLPLIVVPAGSAFTRKVDSKRVSFIFSEDLSAVGEAGIR